MSRLQTITFMFADEHIALGWLAFHALAKSLTRCGVEPGLLEYRWHREEPGGIRATFEVLKTP